MGCLALITHTINGFNSCLAINLFSLNNTKHKYLDIKYFNYEQCFAFFIFKTLEKTFELAVWFLSSAVRQETAVCYAYFLLWYWHFKYWYILSMWRAYHTRAVCSKFADFISNLYGFSCSPQSDSRYFTSLPNIFSHGQMWYHVLKLWFFFHIVTTKMFISLKLCIPLLWLYIL